MQFVMQFHSLLRYIIPYVHIHMCILMHLKFGPRCALRILRFEGINV